MGGVVDILGMLRELNIKQFCKNECDISIAEKGKKKINMSLLLKFSNLNRMNNKEFFSQKFVASQ